MTAPAVTSFTAYASRLVAACPDVGDADRAELAQAMARVGEDHARHFTHPGRARDDAIALFWQVAPAAFAEPADLAAGFDPAQATERMVAAVRESPLGRDFAAAPLPEAFFRAVTLAMLRVLSDRTPG